MNYLEIFDDIVSIAHNDYSGYIDKKGWDNPEPFREKIISLGEAGGLDVHVLKEIADDYLLDFKDDHMHFILTASNNTKVYDNGFKARRYEDKLYVTYVGKETRLKKGMMIISLDDIPVKELSKKYKRQLQIIGTHPEREKWEPVILKHNKCMIEDKSGNIFEMELNKYERESYTPEYSIKELDKGILLIKLTDFNDDDAINGLIEDNHKALNESKNVIIDVRLNRGGSDSAYMKLLDYIFPNELDINELETGAMQLNMTERNYKLRVEWFKRFLSQVDNSDTKRFIEVFIREMDKHKNQGLVEVDLDDAITEGKIHGRTKPVNIVILEDVYCGSSGDAFVQLAGMSGKVTLMGRSSAGITDYSNIAIQEYGKEMQLWYPTSRISSIDEGKGLNGIGVVPKIYIPWTPEHIEKDVDIEKAIEYLLSK
ncbi:MAG: S41 family peptidase [Clostridiaceae bacterium]